MITRRKFTQAIGLGAFGMSICGESLLWGLSKPLPKKPNIIYILADDLGYGDLSCYGQTQIRTPNIDRLAAEGMKFTQHYSGSTVCAPSRCSLMTGLHTGHCQIRGNKEIQPEGQEAMKAGTITVANLLKQGGYVTGAFGKWGLGAPGSEGDPNRQGFDYFFGYNCQRQAHKYYQDHLWRNQEKVTLEGNDPEKMTGQYCHDLIADEALEFIRRNQSQPFFLFAPFVIPHAELAVPEDSLEKYKGKFEETPFPGGHYGPQEYPRAAFAAMIDRMDGDVGRILDLLKELDLDDDTLVMFSSDNGPHQEGGADPDFFDSNGPLRGYKRDLYEGGIRAPMLVRWPGRIRPATETDHISAFWDVLPTCAQLGQVKAPEGLDGISFVPTLMSQPDKQKPHDYLYWEFHEQGGKQAVRKGKWKAVRLDVQKNPDGPVELYDLSNDITETANVADQHPAIAEQMAALMDQAHTRSELFPYRWEKNV